MSKQRFIRPKGAAALYPRSELLNSVYPKGPSVIKSDEGIRIVASIKVQFQEPILV